MAANVIEPLARHHDRAAFACGKPQLDQYLKTQATQDARRYSAAPFVLVPDAGSSIILGYYTLSAHGVMLGELPEAIIKTLPRYPNVPAILLGRLAIDRRFTGQRLGEYLLMDALHRAYALSDEIAAAAIVVDAIDAEAVQFYEHFEFIRFPGSPNRLFLPMKTIARLFPALSK